MVMYIEGGKERLEMFLGICAQRHTRILSHVLEALLDGVSRKVAKVGM